MIDVLPFPTRPIGPGWIDPPLKRELLIGCGHARDKRICPDGMTEWENLTTLDKNPAVKPDVVFDLAFPGMRLPWPNDTFDELHAYEVLEHIGQQGDHRTLFHQFSEFWRVLQPGGYLCGTCPSWRSMWAWGDPSHTRVITSGTLVFLDQSQYTAQLDAAKPSPMSDYRDIYHADLRPVRINETADSLTFILKAIKQ